LKPVAANNDGVIDVYMFRPPLIRAGSEYGGYSAGHYSVKLPDVMTPQSAPEVPEHMPSVLPATRASTEQSTAYHSARSRASTVDVLMKRQSRARVLTDELSEEPRRGVTWAA
jgi:hypothetical protein